MSRQLILASASVSRRQLLERLGVPYEIRPSGVDETPSAGEPPAALAARLALEKARSVSAPQALVIGSDQVPVMDGEYLHKPGSHEVALRQLLACQGKPVSFYTAAVIIDNLHERHWQTVDHTEVYFDDLDEAVLAEYLHREQPFDCAGGFIAEGLGIALFRKIKSDDPTALLGLPLIWVAATLRSAGLDPLTAESV